MTLPERFKVSLSQFMKVVPAVANSWPPRCCVLSCVLQTSLQSNIDCKIDFLFIESGALCVIGEFLDGAHHSPGASDPHGARRRCGGGVHRRPAQAAPPTPGHAQTSSTGCAAQRQRAARQSGAGKSEMCLPLCNLVLQVREYT